MKNEQNDLPNIDTESLVEESTLTLGVLLKKARENKGATIEDIAAQLHLRPAIIKEIEADNLLAVGAATYVRGYVKNYARAVQADPFEVQACLDKQLLNDAEPSMQSFSRKTTRQARDGRLMFLTYFIVLVLLALMVLWWFQKSSMETSVDYSQPTVEEVAASAEDARSNEQNDIANNSSVQPLNEQTADSQSIATDTLSANPQVTVASTPMSAGAMLASIVENQLGDEVSEDSSATKQVNRSDAIMSDVALTLTGDCWIKVTDANGEILINGLKKSGRDIKVSGIEPFALILGAPQVVNIQLNGTQVSLKQYPSGKVARLSLPLAGQ
ncbi:DUF4115 domain-containing protein [Shewanella sp. KX20019]|uniref:RodZ domain-containing protein n=1 Tax=Shewanella sp. KX20019 TaxID=2803864 RepID=UPI001928431D|nr:RodZ domain-containing protein [Shewanella sp. KX20019]QQX81709.1 DUF4115 domain-containing protein [Shewanella sp. KX20019]